MKSSRVLVIVPTHDHPWSLDLAVESALGQTFGNLDVVIIGDGVGDDTREVAARLLRVDDRIRFIDNPKSPSRAEHTRHAVIGSSDADFVTYLGDDDLFFPDHVETMVSLLEQHDFAHPFPICVDEYDELVAFPADLSDPECVEWHLHRRWNTIGLTGAAHTTDLYRRLPQGWTEPPPGWWSDHHFWAQILRMPDVQLATSRRSTVIKSPSALRAEEAPDTWRTSLERWMRRVERSEYAAEWNELVADATRRSAVTNYMSTVHLGRTVVELGGLVEQHRERIEGFESVQVAQLGQLDELTASAVRSAERAATADAQLATINSTRTWRLRSTLLRFGLLRRLLPRRGS